MRGGALGGMRLRSNYRYVNEVPLRAEADPLHVNWCELTITDERDGRLLYHNAFVTNHPISDGTVAAIVAAGRTRWKVENEGNNTLKTKGYHFEHNFGHGQQHLAAFLLTVAHVMQASMPYPCYSANSITSADELLVR